MTTMRALRQERGGTQFELALRVGVQPPAVYLWERGRRTSQVPPKRRTRRRPITRVNPARTGDGASRFPA
jgi:transcriptional regulator with XRE-family HTH domain